MVTNEDAVETWPRTSKFATLNLWLTAPHTAVLLYLWFVVVGPDRVLSKHIEARALPALASAMSSLWSDAVSVQTVRVRSSPLSSCSPGWTKSHRGQVRVTRIAEPCKPAGPSEAERSVVTVRCRSRRSVPSRRVARRASTASPPFPPAADSLLFVFFRCRGLCPGPSCPGWPGPWGGAVMCRNAATARRLGADQGGLG